jgi:hypothetical protein
MNASTVILRTSLAISAVLLLALGCALALDKEKFPYTTVASSCAPWDGPAIELRFSTAPLKCAPTDVIELNISFWRNLPLHDDQTFAIDAKSNWGGASYCKGGQPPCERATSGRIHIESFAQGKAAKGTYDLVFPKLGHVSGSFRAEWCLARVVCG